MRISDAGLALVKRFEGFSATIYVCPAGWPTIGYGHVVRPHENLDAPIGEAEAEDLLARDLRWAERTVERLIEVPLAQAQFDALVSFTFNLGGGALQASTLRQVVNAGEHHLAPDEIRRWVYAGGRRLRGLVRRREAEAALYAQGLESSSLAA